MLKISASEIGTLGMHRRIRACTYELLTMVTEGCDLIIFRCNTAT